ncbi:hypothetical protein So717_21480 [Roseobacter cerasinus]|uniref:Uncharacterized protein n=1 Tax=Roseobacter cerasinus TaxID=2602289 RepID=A0A640VU27_9RHOB|nr:hypothetical protein So717_21480 [Roseobacter cerasinus]
MSCEGACRLLGASVAPVPDPETTPGAARANAGTRVDPQARHAFGVHRHMGLATERGTQAERFQMITQRYLPTHSSVWFQVNPWLRTYRPAYVLTQLGSHMGDDT